MKNIKIFKTNDGSIGLYNVELDEIYHSKDGAKKEAFEKFVEPCLKIENFTLKPLKILDICFGIGYNTKCALANFKNIISIDCVEIDAELAEKSTEFVYDKALDKKINEKILSGIKNSNKSNIRFYFNDIRKVIKKLYNSYDIIFHDGFAPYKQAELWSEELIFEISKKLSDNGLYLTYNHSKPVLKALKNAGLYLGKVVKETRAIATVASKNKSLILNPLNEIELMELETKSAITYKDSVLSLSHAEIIKNREEEIKNSNLETMSHFLKRMKN